MFEAKMIRDHARNYPQIVRQAADKFLPEAAIIVETAAKRYVPVKTGNLRGSINHQIKGDEAEVGTNVEYAQHVEYGTRFSEAQPYMRPAIDTNRRGLVRLLAKWVRTIVSGRG